MTEDGVGERPKLVFTELLRRLFFFCFVLFFQYNFIEHTHVQLTFTKDNLQSVP